VKNAAVRRVQQFGNYLDLVRLARELLEKVTCDVLVGLVMRDTG